jgi:two-component system OmpR family sensor kinase
VVEVADRGVGIAPIDQAHIFERFYRGSAASPQSRSSPPSPARRGFGLGLPIVRELVHAHGGRVEVSSVPGVGSTFRVTLLRVDGTGRSAVSAADPREATT